LFPGVYGRTVRTATHFVDRIGHELVD